MSQVASVAKLFRGCCELSGLAFFLCARGEKQARAGDNAGRREAKKTGERRNEEKAKRNPKCMEIIISKRKLGKLKVIIFIDASLEIIKG